MTIGSKPVRNSPKFDQPFHKVLHGDAGQQFDARTIVWGDFSVESQYVTLGQAAAPAQAAAAAPAAAAARKKERKKAPEKKAADKKMSSAAAQQAAQDEQNAIEHLKVS